MDESPVAVGLSGAEAVIQWFGRWPSFHDAEVISLSLVREGRSILRIYPYYPDKPATVDFVLQDVMDIELRDFSSQNVISGLDIETAQDQNGDKVFRIVLHPCYGLAGRIDVKLLHVELALGKSPDGVSLW